VLQVLQGSKQVATRRMQQQLLTGKVSHLNKNTTSALAVNSSTDFKIHHSTSNHIMVNI